MGPFGGRPRPMDPPLPSLSRRYRHGPANLGNLRTSSSATPSTPHWRRPGPSQDGQLDSLASVLGYSSMDAGSWIHARDDPWSTEHLRAQGIDLPYGAPMACPEDELLPHAAVEGSHLTSGSLASDSGYGSQVATAASAFSGDALESHIRHRSSAHPSRGRWVSVRGPRDLDGDRQIPCRPETEPWIQRPFGKLSSFERSPHHCRTCKKQFRCKSEYRYVETTRPRKGFGSPPWSG